ncbi:MAG: Fic family protein [Conexibacter sp.]
MTFATPELEPADREVLRLIEELRERMRHRVAEPRRWIWNLRRMTFARAVQGSNSIEGYHASLDDVAAVVEDEPALDATEETRLALAGYRDAMTYVLQVAQDDAPTVDEGLLKALHFMMLKHDLAKSPGRWRPGYIGVRREETGGIPYEGPRADDVPQLVETMLGQLAHDDGPVLVRAAMAHLNLVMIHPFRDGNGRMGRALQTLVLAREQTVAPVFSSIEEYLGRNTQAYYDVLAEVGQGAWNPHRSAQPWVRFCLTAHYRQAKTHLRRVEEIEDLWRRCTTMVEAHGLPERATGALIDVSLGLRVRNASYRRLAETTNGETISELSASRDLKAMVDAGLLQPIGERRGRYYVASQPVRELHEHIRAARPPRDHYDPFVVAQQGLQLSLGDGSG